MQFIAETIIKHANSTMNASMDIEGYYVKDAILTLDMLKVANSNVLSVLMNG